MITCGLIKAWLQCLYIRSCASAIHELRNISKGGVRPGGERESRQAESRESGCCVPRHKFPEILPSWPRPAAIYCILLNGIGAVELGFGRNAHSLVIIAPDESSLTSILDYYNLLMKQYAGGITI